jgi:peptidoglycan/xylan/chitin deacetylase (PgdA/CDA1 family)
MIDVIRDTWRKNGPELVSALTRGLPDFVMSASPEAVGGIPVFSYHDVARGAFESHLRFLRENDYESMTADDFLAALCGDVVSVRRAGAERRVVITFDDGLRSLHDTAFPLLREYDIRVVAFIAPAFHAPYAFECSGAPVALPTCTWQQIETLHASGLVDFQSHTLEHRLVSRWPCGVPLSGTSNQTCDRFRGAHLSLEDDLARSREVIQRRLGKSVRHLAFPQYNGTTDAIRIGRSCGYDAFYWGVRPWKPINRLGDDPSQVVRLSGEFLPRLPGRGRTALRTILRERYRQHGGRWWRRVSEGRPEQSS